MKKTLLLALVALTIAATSCVSTHNNKSATANMPVAVSHPAHYQAITEIGDTRVSAEVTGHAVIKFITWGVPDTYADNGDFSGSSEPSLLASLPIVGGDSYGDFKKAATYIACQENGCDSLLDAQYVITKSTYVRFLPFYEKVTCKVTGFPVRIVGHKLIEPKQGPCPAENAEK